MNEENRITLILIDTCAFRDANSDFPGIVKSLLPSFFSTADEKGITLLTHPVLENEIHKHIEDSGIFKDYQSLLTQLRKCTSTLKHYKLDDVLLSSKISELDIQTKLFEAYQQYYQDAIRLDFGDPASVFELYFNSKARGHHPHNNLPSLFQMPLFLMLQENTLKSIRMISCWSYLKTVIGRPHLIR